jgi:hypothetical protein
MSNAPSIGYDFYNMWLAGKYLLAGLNPYDAPVSLYPPAAVFLFALFALLPFQPALFAWTALSLFLFWRVLRGLGLGRQALAWGLFPPVSFVLLNGQNDIFLLWLATWLEKGGWGAVLAGALITLKPQVALIVLPWFLWRWFRQKRATLLRWSVATLGLHALPLLYSREIYLGWIQNTREQVAWRWLCSPGVFTLTNFSINIWLLAAVALGVGLWGLWQDPLTSRAAQVFALPLGLWYENVLLVGSAPWYYLLPVGWLAFGAAAVFMNCAPFAILPAAVLLWRTPARDRLCSVLSQRIGHRKVG